MRAFIIISWFIFSVQPLMCQEYNKLISLGISINPQVATGLPRAESIKMSEKGWVIGGAIGLSLAIELKEGHFFETGFMLSRKGYSSGGKVHYNDSLRNVLLDYSGVYPTESNSYWYYHYFDIPLCYKGTIVRKDAYSMFIKGGFIVNLLHNLSIQHTDVLNTETLVVRTYNIKAKNIWLDPNRLNLSGSLAFGINLPITEQQSLSFEPNINLMLFPVLKGEKTYFLNTGINISYWFL